MQRRKRFTVYDAAVIVLLTVMSVVLITERISLPPQELSVIVRKNGSVVYTAELADIDSASEICVDDDYNVILLIESDGVSVVHSDCSDGVCVNTGKITDGGQSIVCLPARVTVELRKDGTGNYDDIDGVVR